MIESLRGVGGGSEGVRRRGTSIRYSALVSLVRYGSEITFFNGVGNGRGRLDTATEKYLYLVNIIVSPRRPVSKSSNHNDPTWQLITSLYSIFLFMVTQCPRTVGRDWMF